MIKEIKQGDKLIALHVSSHDIQDGTHPITPSEWPLQALMMKRSVGHVFAKHTHKVMDRSTASLQETVVVTKGRLKVTVCTREGVDVGDYEVAAGEFLFLVDGGYLLEVLEDVEFYEFKNGPHSDDKVLL